MAALAHDRNATAFNAAGLNAIARFKCRNSSGSVHHYHSATDYLQLTNLGHLRSVSGTKSVVWRTSGHSMDGLCASIGCRQGL